MRRSEKASRLSSYYIPSFAILLTFHCKNRHSELLVCQQTLVNNLCDHNVGYSSWMCKKIEPWTRFRRFSLYQSPILYNGSRDGIIRTCDIRMTVSDNWPVLCMRQGVLASVTCIRALRDGNYLLSSGLDGSVRRGEFRHVVCARSVCRNIFL